MTQRRKRRKGTLANAQSKLVVFKRQKVERPARKCTKALSQTLARKCTRQDKTRQDMTRQDMTRQDKTRQDKTRQDETLQDKTRQVKTRQDKSRQDKTSQDKMR
jgi:hypothetical protein